MSEKLNFLIHLNAYSDINSTNNPVLNNFKWERSVSGITISEPSSNSINLAPGQSLEIFSGTVGISADATTEYDLSLITGNLYRLSHSGGTLPVFRVSRVSGADDTTQVSVTKNGSVLTFTSTSGTNFDLIANGVVVGDEVRVGSQFNENNQGKYKLLSVQGTSFSVENATGVEESNVELTADFADQINIYSVDGVQEGDKVDIKSGFSSVSYGTYEIVSVSHDYIEFYTTKSLPEESSVLNDPEVLTIHRNSKSFVYIESSKSLSIKIDGSEFLNKLEPFSCGTTKKPGVFMSSSSMKSLEITNISQETASVFYATAE